MTEPGDVERPRPGDWLSRPRPPRALDPGGDALESDGGDALDLDDADLTQRADVAELVPTPESLEERPVREHVAVFEEVHRSLVELLDDAER